MAIVTETDIRGRRILVTGGAGMVGANLVRRLVDMDCRPCLMLRRVYNQPRLVGLDGRYDTVAADLTDGQSVRAAVDVCRPEIVFHFASTVFNPPTVSTDMHLRTNVLGMNALLDAVKNVPDAVFVFAGSASACEGKAGLTESAPLTPTTMFGATKAMGTVLGRTYARVHGMRFVELRLFTPFGPWERPERLIPFTILAALKGEDVAIGHGDQQRDFLHVDDVVDAVLLAANARLEPGTVLNVGSGVGHPIRQVAQTILDLMGNPVALRVGARPTRADEIWEVSGNIDHAASLLGWRPKIAFEDGLRRTIDWIRQNEVTVRALA